MLTDNTPLAKKTQDPPRVGETPPFNDFGPREFLAVLDILSRREQARRSRLSPLTRLGRGGVA